MVGLLGIRFEKQGEKPKAVKEKKSKKERKAERRKEQKKRKRDVKKKKGKTSEASLSDGAKSPSSGSSGDETEGDIAAANATSAIAPASEVAKPSDSMVADEDFFSSLGTVHRREEKMKPDPDKAVVSAREYNPYLRGETSALPAPEASGGIPAHICVGDGGAAWRRRARQRAEQQQKAAEEQTTAEAVPRESRGAPQEVGGRGGVVTPPPRERGVPGGGGWRARVAARRASPPPEKRRERSRSKSARSTPTPQRQRAPLARSPSRSPRGRQATPQRRAASRSRSRGEPSPTSRGRRDDGCESREEDVDEVMRRMQAKYGLLGAGAGGGGSNASNSAAKATAYEEELDVNALGAMAMEAMLAGDMARYEALNKRLEAKQVAMAISGNSSSSTAVPADDEDGVPGQRVQVLEEVDAQGRSRALLASVQSTSVRTKGRNTRGTANAVPGKSGGGFYEDDKVSLDDLIRRERIEGVQDYNSNYAQNILKKGRKFKMLAEDEDEAYALGEWEAADKKMDGQRRGQRNQRQQVNEKGRIQVNMEMCTFCPDSRRFGRGESMISSSQHAYVCVDGFNRCILPRQLFIAPREHFSATTDIDETTWAEIRSFQKGLVRFFEAEDPPKAVLFVESCVHQVSREKALMGGGPHAVVVAYPIEQGLLQEAKAFWKKAFDEAECEWTTQHKKVIPTDPRTGVRKAVPKGFPYVHVDFSMGGGYAHVVDNVQEFPRDFAQHTVAGMCELTVLDRAYTNRDAYRNACLDIRRRFCDGFDWTQASKG